MPIACLRSGMEGYVNFPEATYLFHMKVLAVYFGALFGEVGAEVGGAE